MKRWIIPVGALIASTVLPGCGSEPAKRETAVPPKSEPAPAPVTTAAVPMKAEGYQIVRVIVRNTGYEPDRIQLEAGTPAKVVFVQEATSHCASQIQIPELGVPVTDLPEGRETVVEFSPEQAGTYTFTCGMNMMKGTILVGS
jgi:plastocyanin domain-containing protein